MDSLRHNNVKQMGRLQFCFESCEWINMWNDVANWPFSWDNIHFRFTDARGALVQHRCSFTKCSSYGNCSRETTTQKWDRQCDSLIACRANNFHFEKHKFIIFLFLISFLRFPICVLVLSSVSRIKFKVIQINSNYMVDRCKAPKVVCCLTHCDSTQQNSVFLIICFFSFLLLLLHSRAELFEWST